MNIYEKMNVAKLSILKTNLKKSGENKFAGFKYYELADILPTIMQVCNDLKLFTSISFREDVALLQIVNIEEPTEHLEYLSPMKELQLKGCNAIQALGGTETYQRRYLYMTAFDIIENDMFDAVVEEEEKTINATIEKSIREMIKNHKKSDEEVIRILKELGHDKLSELKPSEIMTFRKRLGVN
jgi:hypothetical protein